MQLLRQQKRLNKWELKPENAPENQNLLLTMRLSIHQYYQSALPRTLRVVGELQLLPDYGKSTVHIRF